MFCLRFFAFKFSAFSRRSAHRFSARSFTSCSLLSLNWSKFFTIDCCRIIILSRYALNKIWKLLEASFLWCGVNFRNNMQINVLMDVLELRQMLLKQSNILFSSINKSTDYLQHAWLSNTSNAEINEIFLLADISIKFWRNTLSP